MGCRGCDRMIVGFKLPIQSVYITTDVVGSNPAQDERTTFCDKVCQRIATGRWFSPDSPVSPPRYSWTIVESGVEHHTTNQQNRWFTALYLNFDYLSSSQTENLISERIWGKISTNKLFLAFSYCNLFFKMSKNMKRWSRYAILPK